MENERKGMDNFLGKCLKLSKRNISPMICAAMFTSGPCVPDHFPVLLRRHLCIYFKKAAEIIFIFTPQYLSNFLYRFIGKI